MSSLMDTSHDPWANSATSTLTSPPEPGEDASRQLQRPPARPTKGRRARAATRWVLVVPFVILAPLALISWATFPRITSPAMIAGQAIDQGLTEVAREAMVTEFASELADRRGAPLGADTMRDVFDRSLTQEWFDEQLSGIVTELDRWLVATGPGTPHLVIDLVPVKTALAADPEAMQMVANFVGCSGAECAPALGAVPDQAELLAMEPASSEAEELLAARGMLQTGRRVVQFAPLVLLGEFALLVLLAPRHGRLRFAGSVVAVVGALVMLVVLTAPGWVGGEAAEAVPAEVPLAASDVGALVSWALEPARSLALWMLVAGAVAVAGSYAWGVLSRRPV